MTQQTLLHRHWHVPVTYGSRVYRVLKKPLFHNRNEEAVIQSRLVYGACPNMGGCWTLSLLGILHGLTGFTIRVK